MTIISESIFTELFVGDIININESKYLVYDAFPSARDQSIVNIIDLNNGKILYGSDFKHWYRVPIISRFGLCISII